MILEHVVLKLTFIDSAYKRIETEVRNNLLIVLNILNGNFMRISP